MLPEVRVMSRPMLPLRAMFEFVALQQQESVSMFMAHITTKDHVDVSGLGCLLESLPCLRSTQS